MLNQVILVGRLVRNPELQLTDSGKKRSLITLAVARGFKNQDGEYDTDFLDCTLWTGIAENTAEYCKMGDVIGVRGRLQTRMIESDDGTKYKKMEIIADKVTFLSSARNDNDDSSNKEMKDDNNGCEKNDDDIIVENVVKETEKKYNRKKK